MSPSSVRPETRLSVSRTLGLAVTALLHGPLAALAGIALRRLPHLEGLPILVGSRVDPDAQAHLQAALHFLAQHSPNRKTRVHRQLLGIFLTDGLKAHGHYSRITGLCTFDPARLAQDSPAINAAQLVQAATEAWLWRRGFGRTPDQDRRVRGLATQAREQFLRRLRARTAA